VKIVEVVSSNISIRYLPAERVKLSDGTLDWNKKSYDVQGVWGCPSCNGTGYSPFEPDTKCTDCAGRGKIQVPHLTISEKDSKWLNNFLELDRSPMFRENSVIPRENFNFLIKKIKDYTQIKLKPEPVTGTNIIKLQKTAAPIHQQSLVTPVAPPKSQRLPDKDGIPQIGSVKTPQEYVPDLHLQEQYLNLMLEIIEYTKLENINLSPKIIDIIISEI
jgi:hypothetical protein